MDWALQVLISWQPGGRWQDLARESYVDSLESLLRQLSIGLLSDAQRSLSDILDNWQTDNRSRLSRYNTIIDSVRIAAAEDLSVFTVVLRELQDLVDASLAQLPDSSLPQATGEVGETS